MTDKRYNKLQIFKCGLLYFFDFELKKMRKRGYNAEKNAERGGTLICI